MELVLPCHNEILKSILAEDALSVFGAGLGIEVVELQVIKMMQTPRNIVFVLNARDEDRHFFMNKNIKKDEIKIVDSKLSVKARTNSYMNPGIVFISPRIFIYDMLVRKIPVHFITGLLVFNAHEIENNMHLEFCLKIFRENNKMAFIKAFTESVSFFRREFNLTSRVLRKLHAKNLLLWPRFHVKIAQDLKNDIDVVEISVSLTKSQTIVQTSLMNLLSQCLQNFVKSAPELSIYKHLLTLDHIISREFFKFVHSMCAILIGVAPRQYYDDLKILRLLLIELTNLNAFEFEEKLHTIKKLYQYQLNSPNAPQCSGNWLLSESADNLFVHSAQRISFITERYGHFKNALNPQILDEINPKWRALMDIFNEISLSELSNYPNPDIWKVLIVCLPKSKINTFFRFKKQPSDYFDNILGRNQVSVDHKSLAYSDGESESDIGDEDVQIDEKLAIKQSEIESWCDRIEYKILRTWSKYDVHNELHNFQPHIIILFDVLLEWIRQIEVFKAIKQVIPIRVYMIVHKSSIEEQMYLSAVETEKEAFETLISEKAIIYMPGEGRHDLEEGNIELDSRKTDSYVGGNVIVDIREFGSELPLVLHKTGFIIQPVTLEIGDYVLTPDIGIERKSVSDLVSSLNSGRLYDQAMALARNYKNPFLLIEFNDNKLFNTGIFSQRLGLRRRGSNTFYVQSKLLLLTLHCSTLKILWSTSPRFTVRLFRELKKGKPDPDLQLVSTITSYESSDDIINVSTNKSFDVLLRLPGVTNKNCSVLARKVNNFSELSQLQKGEIENILGPEGEKLFQIFNTDINRLHE